MSTSFKSYIVQIVYIVWVWILYPLHFSLFLLIYEKEETGLPGLPVS